MLKLIRELLQKIINNIDAGNSNLSEDLLIEAIKMLREFTDETLAMSKEKASMYLHVSRATFDNLVKEGLLPKGKKELGFKELRWYKKDLDNYKNKHKSPLYLL